MSETVAEAPRKTKGRSSGQTAHCANVGAMVVSPSDPSDPSDRIQAISDAEAAERERVAEVPLELGFCTITAGTVVVREVDVTKIRASGLVLPSLATTNSKENNYTACRYGVVMASGPFADHVGHLYTDANGKQVDIPPFPLRPGTLVCYAPRNCWDWPVLFLKGIKSEDVQGAWKFGQWPPQLCVLAKRHEAA